MSSFPCLVRVVSGLARFIAGSGVSPVTAVDSIKVSLLITPAIGCSPPISKHWQP